MFARIDCHKLFRISINGRIHMSRKMSCVWCAQRGILLSDCISYYAITITVTEFCIGLFLFFLYAVWPDVVVFMIGISNVQMSICISRVLETSSLLSINYPVFESAKK